MPPAKAKPAPKRASSAARGASPKAAPTPAPEAPPAKAAAPPSPRPTLQLLNKSGAPAAIRSPSSSQPAYSPSEHYLAGKKAEAAAPAYLPPRWVTVWMMVTAAIVTWDCSFNLLRPASLSPVHPVYSRVLVAAWAGMLTVDALARAPPPPPHAPCPFLPPPPLPTASFYPYQRAYQYVDMFYSATPPNNPKYHNARYHAFGTSQSWLNVAEVAMNVRGLPAA